MPIGLILSVFCAITLCLVSIAVTMTALANPNHMVIGQLVYDVLDDNQKSVFQQLGISPEIWSMLAKILEGIYI